MPWVLIIFYYSYYAGNAVHSVPFQTEQLCVAARDLITKTTNAQAVCVMTKVGE